MKMIEEIKNYNKEFVHEQYTRIVENFKDYEKVSRTKMISEIYEVYSDYKNIIDICTTRELKYLKLVLDGKVPSEKELIDKKLADRHYKYEYEWEKITLKEKFLIDYLFCDTCVPEEILESVKLAIKNVNWNEKKKLDDLNELLVGFCKIQGSVILYAASTYISKLTNIPESEIEDHIFNNKNFAYYVYLDCKDYDDIGKDIPILIHYDFFQISDEIDNKRESQGIIISKNMNKNVYKTLFYNKFNINNSKIKKFLCKLEELPFLWYSAIDAIRVYSMLNIDRGSLKNAIENVPSLANIDLTKFFKLMDDAMDEMPSGVLNGLTPNEEKERKEPKNQNQIVQETIKRDNSYKKQLNAHLSRKDAKMFYKIYFALLEFTNQKYKINNVKIYKQKSIDPYSITDIIDVFWKKKESILSDFCMENPYKFNEEELEIANGFKKGIRDLFIIIKYEEEYTGVMNKDKVYMIKGINDNIDNVVSNEDLPYFAITSILPFKNVLIFDSLFMGYEIKPDINTLKMMEKDYNNSIKYYHM